MIVPRIDQHVVARRHMTGRALGTGGTRCVQGVRRRIVFHRRVTLRTHGIAGRTQFRGMRIVAIGAGHAVGVHPALQEGADIVNLVVLLAIGEVQMIAEQSDVMSVEEPAVVIHAFGKRRAARVRSATRAARRLPKAWITTAGSSTLMTSLCSAIICTSPMASNTTRFTISAPSCRAGCTPTA